MPTARIANDREVADALERLGVESPKARREKISRSDAVFDPESGLFERVSRAEKLPDGRELVETTGSVYLFRPGLTTLRY